MSVRLTGRDIGNIGWQLGTPPRLARLRAATHELRCRECRGTWLSWAQRLLGIRAGMTPRVCICARPLARGDDQRPCPIHGWATA